MAKKYYAVKKGRSTGIFATWEECKASVNGYSGAQYKSFSTPEEAQRYLKGDQAPPSECPEEECCTAYVDGSFDSGREDRAWPGIPGRRGHFYEKCGRRTGRGYGGYGFL